MHKTHLDQIKIFPIDPQDPQKTCRDANDFLIMKFAQCGNYPEIFCDCGYISVRWKELVETIYEPPKREFIGVNTSGLPDIVEDRQKKDHSIIELDQKGVFFCLIFAPLAIILTAIIGYLLSRHK